MVNRHDDVARLPRFVGEYDPDFPSPTIEHLFVLNGLSLSQNRYDRLHWSKKHALRNEWYENVLEGCQLGPRIDRMAKVTLTRVARVLIDPNNIEAATKPIIDALVQYGWLRGDTINDLSIRYEQRKCEKGEPQHMELTLTYV